MRTGGRDDVRTCYLKESLQRDPDIASFAYSYAPPYLHKDWPQVHTSLLSTIQKSVGCPCLQGSAWEMRSASKMSARQDL